MEIEPARLRLNRLHLVRDLPAGGKRFLQTAQGYVGTWVAGQAVAREGQVTDARPGRLVRLGQPTHRHREVKKSMQANFQRNTGVLTAPANDKKPNG